MTVFHLKQVFIFSVISFGLRPAHSRLGLTLPVLCRSHRRQVAMITAAHITAFWLYHYKHNGPFLFGFHCLVTLIVGTTPIGDIQLLFKCVVTFDRTMEIAAKDVDWYILVLNVSSSVNFDVCVCFLCVFYRLQALRLVSSLIKSYSFLFLWPKLGFIGGRKFAAV